MNAEKRTENKRAKKRLTRFLRPYGMTVIAFSYSLTENAFAQCWKEKAPEECVVVPSIRDKCEYYCDTPDGCAGVVIEYVNALPRCESGSPGKKERITWWADCTTYWRCDSDEGIGGACVPPQGGKSKCQQDVPLGSGPFEELACIPKAMADDC